MPPSPIVFGEGFHQLETHTGLPFRWMERTGRLRFAPRPTLRYAELWVRCSSAGVEQRLSAEVDGGESQACDLVPGWNQVSFALPPATDSLLLETNRVLPIESHPGDGRELALQLRIPAVHADLERHRKTVDRHRARVESLRALLDSPADPLAPAESDIRFEEGFYHSESEGGLRYRWMARRARLAFPARQAARFLEIEVFTAFRDLSQRLWVSGDGQSREEHPLDSGWSAVSIPIASGASSVLLEVDPPLPEACHPGDRRELTAQVRAPFFHHDQERHISVSRQLANRVLNRREMLSRERWLKSTPPKLGIDVAGRCNIKPPCVFCQWDRSKTLEGDNVDSPFDLALLRQWGEFFDNSAELVNCSIGEPFMIREIDLLLDAFGRAGKVLELTTNGQILTDANIRKLLGRQVHLYVSIDAASAAGYARLRNQRFDTVVDNLRRLIDAKGGPGRLPLVYLVFMPMRANLHEVDDFVVLSSDLAADRLVLRPLNASEGVGLHWDRGGYHFDYQRELLPFDQLVRVSGRVAELCRALSVPLSDQMSFGGDIGERFAELYQAGRREATTALTALSPSAEGETPPPPAPEPSAPPISVPSAEPSPVAVEAESVHHPAPPASPTPAVSPSLGEQALPLCIEPWSSLYILRRGIYPCCYGGASIASMHEFRQAWNAPFLQQIRGALSSGRFHRYCFDSPDCPLVRKAAMHRDLSLAQRIQLAGQRGIERVKRSGYGWPGRLYRASKRLVRGVRRRLRLTRDGQ